MDIFAIRCGAQPQFSANSIIFLATLARDQDLLNLKEVNSSTNQMIHTANNFNFLFFFKFF